MDVSTARDWWDRQGHRATPSIAELVAVKEGQRVVVLIPARNEGRTVFGVVGPIVRELVTVGLVDEVVVVDGQSTDRTAEAAAVSGATVLSLPGHWAGRNLLGKGGALWWGHQQIDADLCVFLDGDVMPSRAWTVRALLTPLLLEPQTHFVKAAFDRPLVINGIIHAGSGGRVTELMARPLLNRW